MGNGVAEPLQPAPSPGCRNLRLVSPPAIEFLCGSIQRYSIGAMSGIILVRCRHLEPPQARLYFTGMRLSLTSFRQKVWQHSTRRTRMKCRVLRATVIMSTVVLVGGCTTTTLQDAARRGDAVAVQVAFRNGEDVNSRDRNGNTPLMVAASMGRLSIAQQLVDQGADVNASNKAGNTPLMAAAYMGQAELADYLLAHGATLDAHNKEGDTALLLCRTAGWFVGGFYPHDILGGTGEEKSESPQQIVLKGRNQIAKQLITAGADVNARGNGGKTALMVLGGMDILTMLLDKGADVNARDESFGRTPLNHMANQPSLEQAKLFIQRGADVNTTDTSGETPLIRASSFLAAAWEDQSAVVRLLIQSGAKVNARASDGKTALLNLVATRQNDSSPIQLIQFVVESGADVNIADNNGTTPLMVACIAGDEPLVRLLVEKKADVNAVDKARRTPLSLVEEKPHLADLLKAHGAAK